VEPWGKRVQALDPSEALQALVEVLVVQPLLVLVWLELFGFEFEGLDQDLLLLELDYHELEREVDLPLLELVKVKSLQVVELVVE